MAKVTELLNDVELAIKLVLKDAELAIEQYLRSLNVAYRKTVAGLEEVIAINV